MLCAILGVRPAFSELTLPAMEVVHGALPELEVSRRRWSLLLLKRNCPSLLAGSRIALGRHVRSVMDLHQLEQGQRTGRWLSIRS
ncbi:unnamed protein product [Cuscuta campestris]|uniref:Uncharacterized protein n=1 Tax=Cuscuta campestris TaxID=132261 RepID=A0A484KCA6_9ASTE|nr:unnamed protein product [Cuscuta campestris]